MTKDDLCFFYFLLLFSRTYKSTSFFFVFFNVFRVLAIVVPFFSIFFFLLDVLDVSGHIHIHECQVHYEMDDFSILFYYPFYHSFFPFYYLTWWTVSYIITMIVHLECASSYYTIQSPIQSYFSFVNHYALVRVNDCQWQQNQLLLSPIEQSLY